MRLTQGQDSEFSSEILLQEGPCGPFLHHPALMEGLPCAPPRGGHLAPSDGGDPSHPQVSGLGSLSWCLPSASHWHDHFHTAHKALRGRHVAHPHESALVNVGQMQNAATEMFFGDDICKATLLEGH